LKEFGNNIGVAWIYLRRKESETHTHSNVLGSLLRQLLCLNSKIVENSQELHRDFKNGDKRPSLSKLREAIEVEIKRFNQVFIVVDAIDEYSAQDVNGLLQSLQLFNGAANVLVTSRKAYEQFSWDSKAEVKIAKITGSDEVVRVLVNACFNNGIFRDRELSLRIKGNSAQAEELQEGVVLNAQKS